MIAGTAWGVYSAYACREILYYQLIPDYSPWEMKGDTLEPYNFGQPSIKPSDYITPLPWMHEDIG